MSVITAPLRYYDLVGALAAGKDVAAEVIAASLAEAGLTHEALDEHVEQRRRGGLPGRPGASGDAASRWKALVAEKVRQGMAPAKAMSAVEREHPGLREQFVKAFNEQHEPRR